ncbi:MAG: hypothetical protein QNK05_19870 [Myxococcota bacterium]|nr:hypothetical protein [Myxococcota bacterium]
MHGVRRLGVFLILACALGAPSVGLGEDAGSAEAPKLTMGNGAANSIATEGLTREGRTFVFPEVTIQADGWLVLHPFRDGKPVGEIYVGATFLAAGTHENVSITVQTAPEPTPGTAFLVMLHSDVNEDGTFDFVFVDERNVADKAVFEGTTMIAHVIAAP